ncbi:hypothetical protein GX830_01885, partial [Candidatus Dojkabacteria bacterium]|nr:hypothetical protein [Candidatus Dojkabacteria bacterium]
MMNIDQFQGTEEGFSQQDLNQAQFPETQQFPNQQEVREPSPMEYVKENTPSNDPVVPSVNEIPSTIPSQPEVAETEEIDVKALKEDVETIKRILVTILSKKEIMDFSVVPLDLIEPTFEVSNTSKRSMIFPFGGPAIRYGLDEFKKALEKVISLDA